MGNLESILGHFAIEGTIKEVKPLGNGLINDTYKAITEGSAPDYVLHGMQRHHLRPLHGVQRRAPHGECRRGAMPDGRGLCGPLLRDAPHAVGLRRGQPHPHGGGRDGLRF